MEHWSKKHQTKCEDSGKNEGRLELITWDGIDEDGDEFGWRAVPKEEAEELKKLFIVHFKSNEEAFFDYWSRGFRWTCCSNQGDNIYGCDHHGNGSTPYSCDYCVCGRPLHDKIYSYLVDQIHVL